MSSIAKSELDKLSVMYEGDKNRDASSKIRGFLFQDYVTIMCLLDPKVVYVCSEYLEDVDVFFDDGKIEFIQVKYYPRTRPKMEEIVTDLYYQYLRLKVLQSSLEAKLSLYIYSVNVEKPSLDKIKVYIGLGNALPETVTYPAVEESIDWMRANVYVLKKEEQKKKLFSKMASEESLKDFENNFNIEPQTNIDQYKKELLEELSKIYPSHDPNGNNTNWQIILLGLAISYIQKRYALNDPSFEELRIDKKAFDQYMKGSVNIKTEKTVINYLVGIICELYGEIVYHNNLSYFQTQILYMIYQKTEQWISDLCKNVDGQYQLVNTISRDEVDKVSGYKGLSVDDRLIYMAENKASFRVFLSYLWKIMLNICQEDVKDVRGLSENRELIDPLHYIDISIKDYICLNFPEDRVNHSIILPSAGGAFKGLKRKIIGRVLQMTPKPEKWFFENSNLAKGENFYDYYTANVNNSLTVADLGEDGFYIECMDCIGIDEEDWERTDTRGKCVFSERCIKEGYSYDSTGRV